MEFWKLRTHQRGKKNESRVVVLKSGQHITTLPRFIVDRLHINKGDKLEWSEAGERRVLIEIITEPQ